MGEVRLAWRRAAGPVTGYDIYRSEAGGPTRIAEAVKGTRFVDRMVLGGLTYRYAVRPYDASGRAGPSSPAIDVAVPMP